MQNIGTRSPVPEKPFPSLIHFRDPNRRGLLLGHTHVHQSLAQWCHSVLPCHARPLTLVTRALVDNALQHTRSGLPGGTVRVVLDRTRPLLPHLYVTDEGPLPGPNISYPRRDDQAPCSGLALVERLSVYWDFSWSWDGHRIRALTLQVVFDLTEHRTG